MNDFGNMSPEEKYRCKKITHNMVKNNSDMENDVFKYEAASQIRLMIRDGLDINMLDENEYKLMIDVYGEHALKTFVSGIEIVSIDDAKKKFESYTHPDSRDAKK